jgi:hypothetical protein
MTPEIKKFQEDVTRTFALVDTQNSITNPDRFLGLSVDNDTQISLGFDGLSATVTLNEFGVVSYTCDGGDFRSWHSDDVQAPAKAVLKAYSSLEFQYNKA